MAAAGSPLYLGAGTEGAVLAAPEQAVLVLGPPRSGKTTSLVIPNVLAAPGPVVTTSTKPDVLLATAGPRGDAGRCWLWDPSGTVPEPPGVTRARWSPVPACRSWEMALLTARAMTGAARPGGWNGEAGHWTERGRGAAGAAAARRRPERGRDPAGSRNGSHRRDIDTPGGALGGGRAELAADVLAGLAATESRELSGIWSTAAGVLAGYRLGPGAGGG